MLSDILSKLADEKAKKYGLDPNWLKAQLMVESSGDPDAVGPETKWGKAQGAAQLLPSTAKSLGVDDPFDPEQAIEGQAKLLKENLDRYGNMEDATRAYHGGTDKKNWGPKTENYVKKIMANYTPAPVDIPAKDDFDVNFDNTFGVGGAKETAPVQRDKFDDDFDSAFGLGPEKKEESKPLFRTMSKEESDARAKATKEAIFKGADNFISGFNTGVEDIGRSVSENTGITTPEHSAEVNKLFQQEYGDSGWAQGGRVVGNIAGTIPALMAGSAGLGALATRAPALAPAIEFMTGQGGKNALTGLISRITGGAVTGAAATPLISAASDESLGDQMTRNAEIGAVTNPLIRGAVGAGKYIADKGKDLWHQATLGVDELAENKYLQSLLGRDRVADPVAELNRLGPEATLFDIGGENTRGLGRAVAGTPSEGKDILIRKLDERQAGQPERVTEALKRAMGTDKDYYGTVEALSKQREEMAQPLYKEAFQKNTQMESPEIDRILNTPAGKDAMKAAVKKMQNARKLVSVSDKELTEMAREDGIVTGHGVGKGFKMEFLDYVKKGLDDQIEAAKRSGAKDDARIYSSLKKDLVNEMDSLDVTAKAGPNSEKVGGGAYSNARASWAGPSESIEALDMGRNFMKGDSQLTAKQIKDLSDVDKEFFRVGAVRQVKDIIDNTQDGSDVVKRIFGKKSMRDKLEAAFPSRESYEDFARAMGVEKELGVSAKAMTSGSRTTPMKAEMDDMSIPLRDVADVASNAYFGNWLGVAGKVWDYMKPGGMTEGTANALARIGVPESQEAGVAMLNKLLAKGQGKSFGPSRVRQYLDSLTSAYGTVPTVVGANRLLATGSQGE